jgi:hypothetical protein
MRATMTMRSRNRARNALFAGCHKQCDPKLAPHQVKSTRRVVKATERTNLGRKIRARDYDNV